MELTDDILGPWPELRAARDALLARDSEARAAGAALISRALLIGAFVERIPADRLLKSTDAARVLGLGEIDFLTLALEAGLSPAKTLPGGTYWRAGSVYELLKAH